MPPPTPLLIGLSGPSSSGKTTIARLLRSIFSPHVQILHEDDFYRPEAELPIRHGLRDWDCAEAIDIPALVTALRFVRQHGQLPDDLVSKEDQNAVGESGVSGREVEEITGDVKRRLEQAGLNEKERERGIVIVDGFLLFGKSVPDVREAFDLKVMLRASYKDAKERREARTGYVTLEGFWEDPPGYVDFIVWPAYKREHGFLFKGSDVEGDVEDDVVRRLGIEVVPGKGHYKMEDMLLWVVELVIKHLATLD